MGLNLQFLGKKNCRISILKWCLILCSGDQAPHLDIAHEGLPAARLARGGHALWQLYDYGVSWEPDQGLAQKHESPKLQLP